MIGALPKMTMLLCLWNIRFFCAAMKLDDIDQFQY